MPIEAGARFYKYSRYLRERYGVKTFRVSVDAGFSCPNRHGGRHSPGCVYCDVEGSRAPYLDCEEEVSRQIRGTVAFLRRRYGAQAFSLYYQAYSGTNAPVTTLRKAYDYGLSLGEFLELIVATRPDCIDEARADLLASYKSRVADVWVELGLQTPTERTLRTIGRGHTVEQFEDAFALLRARGVKVGVHLIFGLPGEGAEEVARAAEYVAALHPDGVKIHNLRILGGSPLFDRACRGEVPILGWRRYIEYLTVFLPRIPEDVVILRLGFDPPRGRPVLPSSFIDKAGLYEAVNTLLERRNLVQGSLNRRQLPPHARRS